MAWAKTIPVSDRTSQDYIETVQLAGDLAASLPAPPSAGFQSDLRALRVPVFVIRTVREQMRYDTPRLVVTAGQPFEIRFENVDFMPHNLVIVRPGAREKVGLASAKMKPDELDDQGRAFIPDSPDILAATKLIEPRQKTALKLTAPDGRGRLRIFLHLSRPLPDHVGPTRRDQKCGRLPPRPPQPILPSTLSHKSTQGHKIRIESGVTSDAIARLPFSNPRA